MRALRLVHPLKGHQWGTGQKRCQTHARCGEAPPMAGGAADAERWSAFFGSLTYGNDIPRLEHLFARLFSGHGRLRVVFGRRKECCTGLPCSVAAIVGNIGRCAEILVQSMTQFPSLSKPTTSPVQFSCALLVQTSVECFSVLNVCAPFLLSAIETTVGIFSCTGKWVASHCISRNDGHGAHVVQMDRPPLLPVYAIF